MPSLFIRNLLFSPTGLSTAGQTFLRELLAQQSLFRQVMSSNFHDLKPGQTRPRIADFSELSTFSKLLADINDFPPPQPGQYVDNIVVKPQDYLKQAQWSRYANGIWTDLTLEDALNAHLNGEYTLNTGSNNTFDGSHINAQKFFERLGIRTGIKQYLAMDMTWWPYNQGTLQLVEKNILVDTAMTMANQVVNQGHAENPSVIDETIGFTHSYGNFSRVAAACMFDILQIPQVRSTLMAPLGTDLNIAALNEAKATFKGKISIVRPSLDPIEEALTVRQAFLLRELELARMPIDVTLNTSSHALDGLVDSYARYLADNDLSPISGNESGYTGRPGKLRMTTASDGTDEFIAIPRDGPLFRMENILPKYKAALDSESAALKSSIDTQETLLKESLNYTAPTAAAQEAATSLKSASDTLAQATPDTLADIINSVRGILPETGAVINTQIQNASTQARAAGNSDWQRSVDTLNKQLDEFERTSRDAAEESGEFENGGFDPSEG